LVIIVMELLTIDDSEKLLLGFQHIVAEWYVYSWRLSKLLWSGSRKNKWANSFFSCELERIATWRMTHLANASTNHEQHSIKLKPMKGEWRTGLQYHFIQKGYNDCVMNATRRDFRHCKWGLTRIDVKWFRNLHQKLETASHERRKWINQR
jgi:hypothetical protein